MSRIAATGMETWQRTLAQIPTVLGRLAYLASLRDASRDQYVHFGLSQRIGQEESERILRESHVNAFQEWLCFPLERQKTELEEYFTGLDGPPETIIGSWLALEPWLTWVPPSSRDVERKLFAGDLRAVVEQLRDDYGVASRDPDL